MSEKKVRKLRDGTELVVHENDGIRKICECPRSKWAKCAHAWHFSYAWKAEHYRFSLNKHVGKVELSKSEANREAEKLRTAIREGTFHPAYAPASVEPESLTFEQFADVWKKRRGYQLVRAQDNEYRLKTISAFTLPGSEPTITFGQKAVHAITAGDIEAFRHERRAAGLSAPTINHDLKLLRKMFNWGIRERLMEVSPFKIGTETAIRLDRETPRDKRFATEEDEEHLLKAANPQLRAVITAMLDTCCRPGEILSLQWKDVDLERREITILPHKAKTRQGRRLPISTRLMAILEMRRIDPGGKRVGPHAYVFGDEVGNRRKSVRTAWENAREATGLGDFHLADLRHEAGSRFEEAGVPTTYVSKFLGHNNLSTTTRYLNPTRRGLHLAIEKVEKARLARSLQEEAVADPDRPADAEQPLTTKPLIS